jgi:hypothetical protein
MAIKDAWLQHLMSALKNVPANDNGMTSVPAD